MISVDPRLNKPIFQQIIDNLKENIIRKIILPGDKIPSVREMALLLKTNPNTISKAYKELEREKIIETIQGKGTYVSINYETKLDENRLENIYTILKKIIIDTKYMGISKKEFIEIVNELYVDLDGEKND